MEFVSENSECVKHPRVLFFCSYPTPCLQFPPLRLTPSAYQADGVVFEVTRTDGLSFFARTSDPSGEEGENPSDEQSFFGLVQDGLSDLADWLGFR